MIKAIFFDIDGTLLPHDRPMPLSTHRALGLLRQNGIKLFIATGRSPFFFRKVEERLDFEFDGYVLLNGQYCTVGGKIIHDLPLQAHSIERVYPYLKEHKIAHQIVELNYICNLDSGKNFQKGRTTPDFGLGHLPIEPFDRIYSHKAYQLTVVIPREKEPELLAHMPGVKPARWSPDFTDMLPSDGGKAVGIKKMLEYFGFKREESMAFGDEENDLDMMQYVGIGVAMGNAADSVKALADYVTADIENDGIYKALAENQIINE